MTKLAFVIPSYNRPEHVKVAVASIIEQVEDGMDVDVRIVENAKDDAVRETVNGLAGGRVTVTSHPHGDYSDAFRAMFRAAPDADWVWTFGDDDRLEPGALKFMLDLLSKQESLSFIHVAEKKRATPERGLHYSSTLLQLCSHFGWIEMTGFISGNLTRGSLLAKAADTPHWQTYAKSSFVQSCALLEALRDEPCAFLEVPVIDSQEQEQTGGTAQTWAEQNIGARYLFIVDALECMFENGVLINRLPAKFFRYLNLTMWDRFIVHFVNDYFDKGGMWADEYWIRVQRFAQFLSDETAAKDLLQDLEAAKGLMTVDGYLERHRTGLRNAIGEIGQRRSVSAYPFTFVEPKRQAQASPLVSSQAPATRASEASPQGTQG